MYSHDTSLMEREAMDAVSKGSTRTDRRVELEVEFPDFEPDKEVRLPTTKVVEREYEPQECRTQELSGNLERKVSIPAPRKVRKIRKGRNVVKLLQQALAHLQAIQTDQTKQTRFPDVRLSQISWNIEDAIHELT